MHSAGSSRVLVVVVILLVAMLGPLLAYSLYPSEVGGTVSAASAEQTPGPRRIGVSFIEALRHSHYYRGVHKVFGIVIAALPHGFVLETSNGRHVLVVVPGCVLVGGKPVSSRLFVEKLLGSTVTVKGHVFVTPRGPVVKAVIIAAKGHTVVIKPCHIRPTAPCHGPCWRRG